MGDSLRFLFASDLMLGKPLRGLAEWPADYLDDIVDAPYHAAMHVFDATVERSAAFLLLCGNVIEPRTASPRGIRFLFDQCRRLQKHDIDLVWLEGPHDRWDEWPSGLPLPENLHRIGRHETQALILQKPSQPVVRFLNLASHRASIHDLEAAPAKYSIGLLNDGKKLDSLGEHELSFVGIGGRSSYRESSIDGVPVVAPGTHQPRSPGNTSIGCAVDVQLRSDNVRAEKVPTSFVRFFDESLTFDSAPKFDALKDRVGERALDVVAASEGLIGIVRWQIDVPAADYAEMDVEKFEQDLEAWLRREFCSSTSRVWTYRVELHAKGPAPTSWREEDSILGDFLRGLSDYEQDASRSCDFASMLASEHHGGFEQLREMPSEDARERLVARVREVGLRLLR